MEKKECYASLVSMYLNATIMMKKKQKKQGSNIKVENTIKQVIWAF